MADIWFEILSLNVRKLEIEWQRELIQEVEGLIPSLVLVGLHLE